jgi:hypothetical protein
VAPSTPGQQVQTQPAAPQPPPPTPEQAQIEAELEALKIVPAAPQPPPPTPEQQAQIEAELEALKTVLAAPQLPPPTPTAQDLRTLVATKQQVERTAQAEYAKELEKLRTNRCTHLGCGKPKVGGKQLCSTHANAKRRAARNAKNKPIASAIAKAKKQNKRDMEEAVKKEAQLAALAAQRALRPHNKRRRQELEEQERHLVLPISDDEGEGDDEDEGAGAGHGGN